MGSRWEKTGPSRTNTGLGMGSVGVLHPEGDRSSAPSKAIFLKCKGREVGNAIVGHEINLADSNHILNVM